MLSNLVANFSHLFQNHISVTLRCKPGRQTYFGRLGRYTSGATTEWMVSVRNLKLPDAARLLRWSSSSHVQHGRPLPLTATSLIIVVVISSYYRNRISAASVDERTADGGMCRPGRRRLWPSGLIETQWKHTRCKNRRHFEFRSWNEWWRCAASLRKRTCAHASS
jgi:hypothetical protein